MNSVFLRFYIFLIEVQLTYNVILISSVQNRDLISLQFINPFKVIIKCCYIPCPVHHILVSYFLPSSLDPLISLPLLSPPPLRLPTVVRFLYIHSCTYNFRIQLFLILEFLCILILLSVFLGHYYRKMYCLEWLCFALCCLIKYPD